MDKHTLKNMVCERCPEFEIVEHLCMLKDPPKKIMNVQKRPSWCPLEEKD